MFPLVLLDPWHYRENVPVQPAREAWETCGRELSHPSQGHPRPSSSCQQDIAPLTEPPSWPIGLLTEINVCCCKPSEFPDCYTAVTTPFTHICWKRWCLGGDPQLLQLKWWINSCNLNLTDFIVSNLESLFEICILGRLPFNCSLNTTCTSLPLPLYVVFVHTEMSFLLFPAYMHHTRSPRTWL